MYENSKIMYEKEANKNFDEENDLPTSVRGVKIRGTYDTLREAQVRAKVLQRRDKNFNVFVGQVGYWLPWDPDPYNVDKQEYQENELNTLMSKYNENIKEKEVLFENNKAEKIKSARQKSDIIKKNQKEARDKIEELRKILDAKENTKSGNKSHNNSEMKKLLIQMNKKVMNRLLLLNQVIKVPASESASVSASESASESADKSTDYDPLGSNTGPADPWMARKLESNTDNSDNKSDNNSNQDDQPSIVSNEKTNLDTIVKNIF